MAKGEETTETRQESMYSLGQLLSETQHREPRNASKCLIGEKLPPALTPYATGR